ncbi:RHS repeat domain-containing protein [Saccharopolyspora shandongensis]
MRWRTSPRSTTTSSETSCAAPIPTRNLTTRISYDPLGNPAKATTPTGLATTYSHDDLGNRLSVTDPRG